MHYYWWINIWRLYSEITDHQGILLNDISSYTVTFCVQYLLHITKLCHDNCGITDVKGTDYHIPSNSNNTTNHTCLYY